MKTRKFEYPYVIQGRYGSHGWEDVSESDDRKEARQTLQEYRENEPQYPHRMIRRRVPVQQPVTA